ncbi:hypothetical protein QQ977_13540 [Natrialbaceae archaeon AArc-T1-2]|nr:hypothetical protein [Natrialbaceae archaeon AArc-T1-2]WIV66705.1 hypothetical protein QQ977_13540 [Natrialbaceae archaeon AArc-T1-2]
MYISDNHEYHEPDRETFSHGPVGHAEARAGMTVGELTDEYGNAGGRVATITPLHDATGPPERGRRESGWPPRGGQSRPQPAGDE